MVLFYRISEGDVIFPVPNRNAWCGVVSLRLVMNVKFHIKNLLGMHAQISQAQRSEAFCMRHMPFLAGRLAALF